MEKLFSDGWTIKANDDNRVVEFIATKEVVDRDKEIVKVKGISLKEFKKNPVILWSHDRRELPIGKAVQTTKSGDELKIKVEFADAEANPKADMVYRLVKGGFLSAVSIGFMPDFDEITYVEPKRGKKNQARRIFNKVELTEMSVVNIGANQDSLATGKSFSDALEGKVITEEEYKSLTAKEEDEGKNELETLKENYESLKKEIEELKNKDNYIEELFKSYQDSESLKETKQNTNDSLEELYDAVIEEKNAKDVKIEELLK